MNAFVAIQHDLKKLTADILAYVKNESVLCTGLYELDNTQLENLRKANKIYFVVSGTAVCSTAYQMLVHSTIPLVEIEKCRLLILDDTRIESVFSVLQGLPRDRPR